MAAHELTLPLYLERSRRLDVAIWAVVPLFAIYELGLLFLDAGEVRNAADALIREGLGLGGRETQLAVNALLAAALVLVAGWGGEGVRSFRIFLLLLVESFLWAVVIAPLTLFLEDLSRLSVQPDLLDRLANVVYAAGAGLHEELLFRLAGVGGGAWLLARGFKVDPVVAAVLAVLGAALSFSAFHHLGSLGEPFTVDRFTFRFLAGVLLGVLFVFRGFAVCAWAHALYDVLLALDVGL